MTKELLFEILLNSKKTPNILYSPGLVCYRGKERVLKLKTSFGEYKSIIKHYEMATGKVIDKDYSIITMVEEYYHQNDKKRQRREEKLLMDAYAYIHRSHGFTINLSYGGLLLSYDVNPRKHSLERPDTMVFSQYMFSYLRQMNFQIFKIWEDDLEDIRRLGRDNDFRDNEYHTPKLREFLLFCSKELDTRIENYN